MQGDLRVRSGLQFFSKEDTIRACQHVLHRASVPVLFRVCEHSKHRFLRATPPVLLLVATYRVAGGILAEHLHILSRCAESWRQDLSLPRPHFITILDGILGPHDHQLKTLLDQCTPYPLQGHPSFLSRVVFSRLTSSRSRTPLGTSPRSGTPGVQTSQSASGGVSTSQAVHTNQPSLIPRIIENCEVSTLNSGHCTAFTRCRSCDEHQCHLVYYIRRIWSGTQRCGGCHTKQVALRVHFISLGRTAFLGQVAAPTLNIHYRGPKTS